MPRKRSTKFVFVSGGVISGLGKGTATASIGLLLKSAGYKVSAIKADMYLNVDAGTMNPIEHGEVFVTDDGLETDQDIGNYERFLSNPFCKRNYITMGQIYEELLRKERALEFKGKTVQGHIHVPEEIISRLRDTAEKDEAEVVMIEVGGTVGEYQNVLFFEAIRRMKQADPKNVFLIHLVYMLYPAHLGEMKSKPAQTSIYELYRLGLSPDMVITRSDREIDKKRNDTLAFNTGIAKEHIFNAPNIDNVYKLPTVFAEQKLDTRLLKLMNLPKEKRGMIKWNNFIENSENTTKDVKIGIVGKYFASGDFSLQDAYFCVIEAIKHAAWTQNINPIIEAVDVEDLEDKKKFKEVKEKILNYDAVIVPQGWGSRGVEGKIKAIQIIRENKIPFLGLCFGMQMAVIEFARNILGIKDANTLEANPKTKNPVIYVMPDQKEYLEKKQYGGTIRLGAWDCKVEKGTIIEDCYKKFDKESIKYNIISERHRHRYEVNNDYKEKLITKGLNISGNSLDGKLAETIELDKKEHPFFVATQFHPEYKSWPLRPHPLFMGLIEAASNK